jgi:hypothetical protein
MIAPSECVDSQTGFTDGNSPPGFVPKDSRQCRRDSCSHNQLLCPVSLGFRMTTYTRF